MPKVTHGPTATPDAALFDQIIQQGMNASTAGRQPPLIVPTSAIDDVPALSCRPKTEGNGVYVDPAAAVLVATSKT